MFSNLTSDGHAHKKKKKRVWLARLRPRHDVPYVDLCHGPYRADLKKIRYNIAWLTNSIIQAVPSHAPDGLGFDGLAPTVNRHTPSNIKCKTATLTAILC